MYVMENIKYFQSVPLMNKLINCNLYNQCRYNQNPSRLLFYAKDNILKFI